MSTDRLPGDVVPYSDPAHQPIVPKSANPPWCSCGWRSARFPKPGEYLADHLREVRSEPILPRSGDE